MKPPEEYPPMELIKTPTPTDPDHLQAALAYAKRGWPVVPLHSPSASGCTCNKRDCQSPAKHPRTQNGLKDATCSEEKLRYWWGLWPVANIGVVCGKAGGFFVLDVDPRNGGSRPEKSPPTVESSTGGGGSHLFFAYPEIPPRRWPKGVGSGLDIKSDGGYIVAPPSLHSSGDRYQWFQGRAPDEIALASPPTFILNLLNAPGKKVIHLADDAPIPEGRRNETLARIAGQYRRLGMTPRAMFAALSVTNQEQCLPPVSDDELAGIVQSIGRYAPAEEQERPPPPGEFESPPQPAAPVTGSLAAEDMTEEEAKELRPFTQSYASLCQIIRHFGKAVFGDRRLELDLMVGAPSLGGKELTDSTIGQIRETIEHRFVHSMTQQKLKFQAAAVRDAVGQVAAERPVHPVARYLSGLKWDGTPRLDTLVGRVFQSHTPDAALLLRKWFISAARRPLVPGCKVDTVLILVGIQSAKKSTFFNALTSPWFSSSPIDYRWRHADACSHLRRHWCLEWAELESMLKARDAESTKSFISASEDTYRQPYAHYEVTIPRRGVIVGTTNQTSFLDDPTGSRRFWVIGVDGLIDIELIRTERDQLWAEAVVAVNAGEAHWLARDRDMAVQETNREYEHEDPWTESIRQWLVGRNQVTTDELLDGPIAKPVWHRTRGDEMRVSAILIREGWKKNRAMAKGTRTRFFSRT